MSKNRNRGWRSQPKRHSITSYGAYSLYDIIPDSSLRELVPTIPDKCTYHSLIINGTNAIGKEDFSFYIAPLYGYNKKEDVLIDSSAIGSRKGLDYVYSSGSYTSIYNYTNIDSSIAYMIKVFHEWQIPTISRVLPEIPKTIIPFVLKYNNISEGEFNNLPDVFKAMYFYTILHALCYRPHTAYIYDEKFNYLFMPSRGYNLYVSYIDYKNTINKFKPSQGKISNSALSKKFHEDLTKFMAMISQSEVLNYTTNMDNKDIAIVLSFIFTNAYNQYYGEYSALAYREIYRMLSNPPSNINSNKNTDLDTELINVVGRIVEPDNDIKLLFVIVGALAIPSLKIIERYGGSREFVIYNRHTIPYFSFHNDYLVMLNNLLKSCKRG